MRIKNREEGFDDVRKFVVDFQMHAGGEESECFEQPLHMRIVTLPCFELQPARYFRIALCELGAGVAQERQFALVVKKQIVAQPCYSFTLYMPRATSKTVSKAMRSGAGSIMSSASTWKSSVMRLRLILS